MMYTSALYLWRNKIRTILMVLLIAFVALGEMTGLLLKNISQQAEKDAYLYNGAAVFFEDEDLKLTRADYEKIRRIPHVSGVGNWKELIVQPLDSKNVKEHTGADPVEDIRGMAGKMVIVAHMDTAMYRLFRWEKSVSLVEGEFPDYNNKGLLIEQRYADLNQLKLGDEVSYAVSETGQEIELKICGIYKVDSEFEILKGNEEGTSVYIHSPYNTMFMDYDNAVEMLGLNYDASTGGELYIDEFNNIQQAVGELRHILGEDVAIYDNTTGYLENECRIVGLMKKTSTLICILVLVMGEIMILLIFSFFANQCKRETGLFLVLGESRGWCIGRYALIGAGYVVGGLLAGWMIYQMSAGIICSLISDVSMNVISSSQYIKFGGYITPNLGQGFEIEVSGQMLYADHSIIILVGMAALSWIFTLILPLHSIFTARPRVLLNSSN